MKIIAAASLIAAQLLAAAPARAADLVAAGDPAQVRMGAFAGARVRLDFGGRHDGQVRAGLALTPFSRSQTGDGRVALRYGEGLEFGISGREPALVRLVGFRLAPSGVQRDGSGPRLGLSTLETTLVVGGVIVAGLLGLAFFGRSGGCCD